MKPRIRPKPDPLPDTPPPVDPFERDETGAPIRRRTSMELRLLEREARRAFNRAKFDEARRRAREEAYAPRSHALRDFVRRLIESRSENP